MATDPLAPIEPLTPQGDVVALGIPDTQDYPRLVFAAPYHTTVAIADLIEPSVLEAVQGMLPTLVPPYVNSAANAAVNALAVLLTGSTMTGPLYLSGLPTQPTQAADKQYVDTMVATGNVPEVPPVPSGQTWARQTGQWVPLAGGGSVSNITTGAGLTGGPITTTGTISMANMNGNTLKGNNTASVTAPTDLNVGQVMAMLGAAPLNSPNFAGTPTLPTGTQGVTQPGGTNNTSIATTAFVAASITTGTAAYLPRTGGTMTGAIVLAGNAAANLNPVPLQQLNSAIAGYLALAGGTLTGPLVLSADPASALQPATKQYVDARAGAPNKLINPFMEIDQAGEGALVTLTAQVGYIVDGVNLAVSLGTMTGQRSNDAPVGYPNSVLATTTATGSVVAGSLNYLRWVIEADELADTRFGTSSAQNLSLAFWVKASIAGTYCAALRNDAGNRSLVFNIVISSANVWQLVTQTIPGDTTGTWVTKGNVLGAILSMGMCVGSTYQTPTLNAWQAGNFLGSNTISNAMPATNGSTFQLGPCGLWVAPAPQPLLRTSIQAELARCQRYFEKSYDLGIAIGGANAGGSQSIALIGTSGGGLLAYATMTSGFKTSKRALPTITMYSPVTGAANKVRDQIGAVDIAPTVAGAGMNSLAWYGNPAPTALINLAAHWTADARL